MRDGLVQPSPETIDTIHDQALRLSRLVEDLRLLSQVESGDLELQLTRVSLEDVLQSGVDAVRPRAEAKGVSLTLEVVQFLPIVEMDATRISQAIGNLLEKRHHSYARAGQRNCVGRCRNGPAGDSRIRYRPPGLLPMICPGCSTGFTGPTPPVPGRPAVADWD